jgi:phage terminase small subunit
LANGRVGSKAYQAFHPRANSKTAREKSAHLLADPIVLKIIDEKLMEQRERTQISADKILQELLLIARSDISLAFRKDGTLKPIHEIPEEVRRAISGVETLETLVGKKLCRTNKVKFWDKVAALGLLGKNLKLFTDQVNVTGTIKTIRVKSNVDTGGDGE